MPPPRVPVAHVALPVTQDEVFGTHNVASRNGAFNLRHFAADFAFLHHVVALDVFLFGLLKFV